MAPRKEVRRSRYRHAALALSAGVALAAPELRHSGAFLAPSAPRSEALWERPIGHTGQAVSSSEGREAQARAPRAAPLT
eukprot:s44_g11.t1